MKRSILLTGLVAAALLSADGARAQSSNRGFMLNAHLTGAAVAGTTDDAEVQSGRGLGVALGYGFTDRTMLYLNLDGGFIEYEQGDLPLPDDGRFDFGTVDLALRMSFGNEFQKLRPFLDTGLTGLVLSDEVLESESTISGAGLTLGGGVQYFFSRSLALDATFNFTTGSFTTYELDGDEIDLDEGVGFNHSRLLVGVSWHP